MASLLDNPATIKCFCCDLNWTKVDTPVAGTPPDFRPHPTYQRDLAIVRQAFREMG